MATLKAEWKKVCKLQTELIEAAFMFGRYHNKDNLGTAAKQKRSRERLLKAIDAMHEYLMGQKIVKIKPPKQVTGYRTESKMVYLINKE